MSKLKDYKTTISILTKLKDIILSLILKVGKKPQQFVVSCQREELAQAVKHWNEQGFKVRQIIKTTPKTYTILVG